MLTAYHEAGHAVVAIMVGRSVQKVSIVPNRTRIGACEIKKGRFQPSGDWLEDDVLIMFAGAVAESRLSGRYHWQGAEQDLRNIRRLTRSRAGDETRAEKLERRLLAKTEHLLGDDVTWKTVEQIATELLARETISGRSAMHIHNQNVGKRRE